MAGRSQAGHRDFGMRRDVTVTIAAGKLGLLNVSDVGDEPFQAIGMAEQALIQLCPGA